MTSGIGRAGARTDATADGIRRSREWRELLGMGFRVLGLDVSVRPNRFRGDDHPSDFEHEALADVLITSTTAERASIGLALDEAEALARVARRRYGVVIQKRRDAPPDRAFVTMSVASFAALMLDRAGRRPRLVRETPPPPGRRS